MLELSAVLSSDAMTRNFTRFSAGALYRGLADLWSKGIPSTVGHDSHRLAGWMIPTAVSFGPGLTRLHGLSMVPETKEEQEGLEGTYQQHLARRMDTETAPYLEELRRLTIDHLRGDETPLYCGAAAFVAPDLARRLAPEIFSQEDKDGLVPLGELHQIQPGIFQHGELVLFAHQSLRRSMSRWNNLNAPLLIELHELARNPKVRARIRLDADAVGLASSAQSWIELEYWYGPKFSDDLAAIPRGVTRHEASDRERYFHGVSRTEFWWQSRDGLHTLEAEELRNLPTFGSEADRFGCRYIHSIVGEATGRIEHLDGAVRDYSEEQLLSRLDVSIAEAGRHTAYTKGWRVDGDIPLSRWKLLIHHHFRDNPLVSEYLDNRGAVVESKSKAEIDGTLKKSQPSRVAALVPVSMKAGDRVRILLSLQRPPQPPIAAPRVVYPLEVLTDGNNKIFVIDADTHELEKILRRVGEQLVIPETAARLAFEDRYHTFPLILHDSPARVAATIAAFDQLVSAWNQSADDRVVALSMGVVTGDRELRVALVGHVADLPKHIRRLQELFACQDDEAIADWVDKTAEFIQTRVDDAVQPTGDAVVDRLMTPDATFRIARKILTQDELVLQVEGEQRRFKLRIPVDDHELLKAVREGELGAAFAWVITESSCCCCGASYFQCPCSKYLDDGVGQTCTDATIAYPFWTDRPA